MELGTIPLFGTLTHSKAAPERLCNQTELVQSYLAVSLTSSLLASSSAFGITGPANPEPDFLEQDLLSQVFWH